MRRLILPILLLLLLAAALPVHGEPVVSPEAGGELVTLEQAGVLATNFVALTIHSKAQWGDSPTAEVAEVAPFRRGSRLLGYFCRIEPRGYIIVSLRRELSPVKAYSVRASFAPEAEEEYVGIVKTQMESILDAVEREVGPLVSASSDDLVRFLSTDHRPTWEQLSQDPAVFQRALDSGTLALTDAERVLPVTSTWDGESPFNAQCPYSPECDPYRWRYPAGCVAVAAAQIMRYWAWPPYGVGSPYNDFYDWPNMLDEYTDPYTPTQGDAVAELCFEAGRAAATDYGCDGSDAWVGGRPGADMTDAFKSVFRYSDSVDFEQRWHIGDDDWFNIIKGDIDNNQPLQYAFLWGDSSPPGWSVGGKASHSMVCDGYRIVGSQRFFHMNYGWGETCRWDDITEISGAEGVIRHIRPAPSLGSTLTNFTYSAPAFPYRYLMQNTTGSNVTFDAGHYLQFLSGVKLTCVGTRIAVYGWSDHNTRLFTEASWAQGIRVHSGHLYLYNGGSIRLH